MTTADSGPPPSGFECLLTRFNGQSSVVVASGNATNATSSWRSCLSPYRRRNLTDGTYLFQVRPAGEACRAPN